jgi:hypothetical protein
MRDPVDLTAAIPPTAAPTDATARRVTDQEQAVLDAIRATPYGSVEVVLHQSRIVQVVRTQKLKLDPASG